MMLKNHVNQLLRDLVKTHNKQSQFAPSGPDLAVLGRCSERYVSINNSLLTKL